MKNQEEYLKEMVEDTNTLKNVMLNVFADEPNELNSDLYINALERNIQAQESLDEALTRLN